MSGRRGFTLLEMVVATTIMGVAIVGLLSGISGATRNAAHLRDYGRVTQLAREEMNELLANYTLPHNIVLSGEFDPSITGGLPCGWQAQVTTIEKSPNPAPGQLALDRISLQVWWMAGSERRSLPFEALRKRYLTAEDIQPAGAP